ncbi:MAG: discoidin domain-containing protein, partial [Bacillota bacterium]
MKKFVLLLIVTIVFMPQLGKASDLPLKNLALDKPYKVITAWPDDYLRQLEETYEDTGSKELTDGDFGSTNYTDSAWRSFLRQGGRTIIVDLGEVKTINEITGHFLQFWDVGIFVPRFIDYYLSLDNESFAYMGQVETSVGPWNLNNQKEQFTLKGLNHQARYVKIQFPADVNVFMDELEVFGIDGVLPASHKLQITEERDQEKLWEKSAILGP